jgi:hypothetical protein
MSFCLNIPRCCYTPSLNVPLDLLASSNSIRFLQVTQIFEPSTSRMKDLFFFRRHRLHVASFLAIAVPVQPDAHGAQSMCTIRGFYAQKRALAVILVVIRSRCDGEVPAAMDFLGRGWLAHQRSAATGTTLATTQPLPAS